MKFKVINIQDICFSCGKIPQMALNRPHSQHKTKKIVRPNLGPWQGGQICAKCRKAIAKPIRVRKYNVASNSPVTPVK